VLELVSGCQFIEICHRPRLLHLDRAWHLEVATDVDHSSL